MVARWLRKAACTSDDIVQSRDRANTTKGIDALLVKHSDFDSNRMPEQWRSYLTSMAGLARRGKEGSSHRRSYTKDDQSWQGQASNEQIQDFIQTLGAKKQKAASKIIKVASTNSKIIHEKTRRRCTLKPREDRQDCEGMEDYLQELAKPRIELNKGEGRPECETIVCSWEQKIDPFKLQTRGHTEMNETSHPCILALLKNKCQFLNRLRNLARNKAPGKDGVQNEILKNLPDDLLDTIHKLYLLRYLLGQKPADRKTSQTVLLHKKGSPLGMKDNRPIALANTMPKLYTGCLTDCMSGFTEKNDILSSSREKFKRGKGTARQLLMMQNVLSDAHLFGKDIYVMDVNFSSAFNNIDHNKVLLIMRGLGVPENCIEGVKDLCTDARTESILPAGNTNPIKIERGTIQGDSLSPSHPCWTSAQMATIRRPGVPLKLPERRNELSGLRWWPLCYDKRRK